MSAHWATGYWLWFARLLALTILSVQICAAEPTSTTAGNNPLPYAPPRPGTYTLPDLGPAADGSILDMVGTATTLHTVYDRKITLLSFIYAACQDANGCPLATSVLHRIQSAFKAHPEINDRLRLITLSFDPVHDTPAVMSAYGRAFRNGGLDWLFLTTRSETELKPILRDYQQTIEPELNEKGQLSGQYSHLLRVYLIDQKRHIRNIYSASVLHPSLIMADIETLQMESTASTGPSPHRVGAVMARPGDDKTGYETIDYQTHSAALTQRTGAPADLYRRARFPIPGLPKVVTPPENPMTREKISLGRKLFYDRRLSLNNTFSCAMCHVPEQGFTSQEQATAIGIEGHTVRRNAPTIYNVAFAKRLFHDGRESTLENQVWGPLLAPNEMGNPSVGAVIDKLKILPDYRGQFERAFRRGPSMDTVGQALANYERTLIAGDSPFDRWLYGKQSDAMSAAAQSGYTLFTGKAGCSQCHLIGPYTALFTDYELHNTGMGYQESMRKEPEKTHVQVAPGIAFDLDATSIQQVAEPRPNDLGLYEITQNPADRWKYLTPSLRNISLTAPYMHDGGLATLTDVVEFYNRGGVANETLDSRLHPLNLDMDEKRNLVAFLNALTASDISVLVSDAWNAPVGER